MILILTVLSVHEAFVSATPITCPSFLKTEDCRKLIQTIVSKSCTRVSLNRIASHCLDKSTVGKINSCVDQFCVPWGIDQFWRNVAIDKRTPQSPPVYRAGIIAFLIFVQLHICELQKHNGENGLVIITKPYTNLQKNFGQKGCCKKALTNIDI